MRTLTERQVRTIAVALRAAYRALDRASSTVAYADDWVCTPLDRVTAALQALDLKPPRVPRNYE